MYSYVIYPNFREWFVILRVHWLFFQLFQCFQAIDHSIINKKQCRNYAFIHCTICIINLMRNLLSKQGILQIQVRLWCISYKKLTAICVRAIVGHGDETSDVMLQLFLKLIFKFTIPYRGTSFSRLSRISSLDDEAFYVSMEQAIAVIPAGAECEKILKCKMSTLSWVICRCR